MSRVKEFNLPDLGEGLTEGEILDLVSPGSSVEGEQTPQIRSWRIESGSILVNIIDLLMYVVVDLRRQIRDLRIRLSPWAEVGR